MRRELAHLARHPVVEPGAEGDEQVALLQAEHGRNGAVHARHAEVLRVRVGEGAAGHERRDDGRSGGLGEGEQLAVRSGADDPAADVQHGLLGLDDELGRGLDLLAVRLGDGAVAGQLDLRRPVERRRLLLGVLRDVDEHGAGAPGRGDVHGGGEHGRHVLRLGDEERVLRDGHRDARDVDLLEGVGAHRGREHLAGDREHRHRVHVGVGDRRDQVRGARARGGDADAEAAARGGVALGRVAGALLVAHEDVADGRGGHELVVERHDRAAREPEHVGDAELLERGEDGARPGEHRRF